MALRTLQPDPQEQLRDGFHPLELIDCKRDGRVVD